MHQIVNAQQETEMMRETRVATCTGFLRSVETIQTQGNGRFSTALFLIAAPHLYLPHEQ